MLIRPDKTKVYPKYLLYRLLGDEVQDYILTITNGATVHHLNVKDIRELPIRGLPSLPTQRKIADILSAYDDLIENNTRRIAILEEIAQRLYQEWFVHFRYPGHEDVPLVDSELGLIPEGWEVKRLGKVTDVNPDSIKGSNAPEEIQYVDISSVSTGSIDYVERMDFSSAPSRARRVAQHGDVIWATVRPNRKSYALVINPVENLEVSTGFAVIRGHQIPYSLLYQMVTTEEFAKYLTNRATGAAYPAVNANDFEQAQIIVPGRELTETYHDAMQPVHGLRESLRSQNSRLQVMRDLLVPKLVSERIVLPDHTVGSLPV